MESNGLLVSFAKLRAPRNVELLEPGAACCTFDACALDDARGAIRIVPGDARLSLEHEPPQEFDVLAVDAFTSDAVPIHLLTDEAFALYWSHLRPDGVLAVHVTNRYLNLARIVAGSSVNRGRQVDLVMNTEDPRQGGFSSEWMLVSSAVSSSRTRVGSPVFVPRSYRSWTDDFGSIWTVMK